MAVGHWLRLWRTVRHLKPTQCVGRVRMRLRRPRVDRRPPPEVRRLAGSWDVPARRSPSLVGPARFRFLNVERDLGAPGDWDVDDVDRLWRYNLHYFDDLAAHDAPRRAAWHRSLIERWIDENPPGVGTGWEPYPLSLRIVNWIKWQLAGERLSQRAVHSLAVQTRCLAHRIEYHLLGNHLLANAKALVFAGAAHQGPEADRWLDTGLRIYAAQLPEQVLADGGHFERSPMYHSVILEDLLDLINLGGACGVGVSTASRVAPWSTLAERMLAWLAAMCHPDGQIALLNDAAFDIAPPPSELFRYAQRLHLPATPQPAEGLTHLSPTGYVRVQHGPLVALLDVAPIGPDYLPGHAHADTLSFELSLGGRRLVVDSGTSCYAASAERLRQRGTAAHNTVVVDGEDSSEVWSSFRVARRARPRELEIQQRDGHRATVSCSHDGYRRLAGRVTHRRSWQFEPGQLTIRDQLDGEFEHAVAALHLAPEVVVEQPPAGDARRIDVRLGEQRLSIEVEGGRLAVQSSTYHPQFGTAVANCRLVLQLDGPCATWRLRSLGG